MHLAKRLVREAIVASLGLIGFAAASSAQGVVPTDFSDLPFRNLLNAPSDFAFLPDGRILVIETYLKRVRLITTAGAFGSFEPALSVDSVNANGGERGLLSLAIDPRWPVTPYVYVYYTALDGFAHITRYEAIGDLSDGTSGNLRLDPASKYHVIRDIPDATPVDNGGCLRFAPDSTLFVSLGQDDGECAAQDTTSLRGVILRIDVRNLPAGPGGPADKSSLIPAGNPFAGHPNANARLVWSVGLRNPFRFQVDEPSHSLFVGDVGGATYEEVDIVSAPGLDFGWPVREGPAPRISCPGPTPTFTSPIYFYQRPGPGTNVAVIGAGVYRATGCPGCHFPADYEGDYFLSDYYQGFLRRLEFSAGTWQIAASVPGQPDANNWGTGFNEVSAWVMGADGALWYCRQATGGAGTTGQIRRIVYSGLVSVRLVDASLIRFSPPTPSPALGEVRLEFTLAREAIVSLGLYDTGGRIARSLLSEVSRASGTHRLEWDGRLEDGTRAPAGLYFASLRVGSEVRLQRIALLR